MCRMGSLPSRISSSKETEKDVPAQAQLALARPVLVELVSLSLGFKGVQRGAQQTDRALGDNAHCFGSLLLSMNLFLPVC